MSLHRWANAALSISGIVLVFGAVLLLQETRVAMILTVLVGILLIEAGVWKLSGTLLPTRRKYLALRAEVRAFLASVPRLNRAAVEARAGNDPEAWERVRKVLAEMHEAVDRMGEAAGQEEGEPPTRPPA